MLFDSHHPCTGIIHFKILKNNELGVAKMDSAQMSSVKTLGDLCPVVIKNVSIIAIAVTSFLSLQGLSDFPSGLSG